MGLALTGDGSFTMNPQILIDGAQHGARGCILLLDNGRMGAISGLQEDQYGTGFATWNTLQVDYLAWARCRPGTSGTGRWKDTRFPAHCAGPGRETPGSDIDPRASLLRSGSAGRDGCVWTLERGQLV